MAFNRNSTALFRMASNSCFCWSTERPGLEGQSMFPTVATQAPRNSRWIGGGVTLADESPHPTDSSMTASPIIRQRDNQAKLKPGVMAIRNGPN